MSGLQIFKNTQFGEVRTVLEKDEVWFVGKDIANILGYSDTNKAIAMHVDSEDKLNDKNKLLGQRGGWLINESGVLKLITKSKTKTEDFKRDFINWLKEEKLIDDSIVLTSRKEIEFLDKLTVLLSPFNVDIEMQYKVLNYKIDAYIPSLNIAIEYDENNHKDYSFEQHELRQKEIEDKLKCKFIRVSDKDSDELNMGIILKEIMEIR